MIRKRTEKRPIYRNIFVSLALSVILLVTTLSVVFYFNIEKVLSNQISMANLKSLRQISEEVNLVAGMASTISYQIYNDVTVSKLLYFKDLNIYDESLAMSQIANYRIIFPMIDSIYVYNGNSDTFYVRSNSVLSNTGLNKRQFFDRQVVNIIEHYQDYRPGVPIARRFTDAEGNLLNVYYTFIMYNDLWSRNNAAVVNINESFIQEILDDNRNGVSETFIMDDKGFIVSNSEKYGMLTDVSEKDFVGTIRAQTGTPGFFVADVMGTRSLVVHTAPDSFGWTYVRIFEWDALFSTISKIKMVMVALTGAILLVGIFSSFFLARQLYRPIYQMIGRLGRLEEEKKDGSTRMKQELLRDMLLDSIARTRPNLYQPDGELGLAIGIMEPMCVILLRIDRFRETVESASCQRRDAWKNAIVEKAAQFLSPVGPVETLDMDERTVVVLLGRAGTAGTGERGLLQEPLEALLKAIGETTDLSLSVGVSTTGENLETVRSLYLQAMNAAAYRFFRGYGSIVFAEDVRALPATGHNYPVHLEKALTEALFDNRIAEAKRAYDEMVRDTANYPISVFNLTAAHLLFTLNSAIQAIVVNHALAPEVDMGIPPGLLSDSETLEAFSAGIHAIFDRLGQALEEKRSLKGECVVHSINAIIQEKFDSPDLSVSGIAEAMNLSDAYLCRIYKQHTMRTILETVVNLRMEKARTLLRETREPITAVAEKCGFNNSTYFHTVFKSANGITPSEFRKTAQTGAGAAEAGPMHLVR